MPNLVRLMLSNGEVRHIDAPEGRSAGMVKARMHAGDVMSSEWIETLEKTLVHRSQIVEAILVDDDKPVRPLAETL